MGVFMAIHDLATDAYHRTGTLLVCVSADSTAFKMLPRHTKIMGMSKLLFLKAHLPEKI